MTLTEIKAALAQHQLSPLKQLGQNFLHDQNLAIALAVRALAPIGQTEPGTKKACVIEIGPGLGSLTVQLLPRSPLPLIALEMDRGISEFLRQKMAEPIAAGAFELREGDALQTLPALAATHQPALIVGNLPYNISTPLLMTCWEHFPQVRTFFLLQKEVGQRIVSRPGSKIYGGLSVILQTFYQIELVRNVPATVFYPAPDVQSVILECRPQLEPKIGLDQRAAFVDFVHRGFSQRRKKLSNLLPVTEQRRAEELSPADWVNLWQATSPSS